MLVIDASMTMNRTGIEPTRLAAAQSTARTLLEKLPADFRVGLVTYAIEPSLRAQPRSNPSGGARGEPTQQPHEA